MKNHSLVVAVFGKPLPWNPTGAYMVQTREGYKVGINWRSGGKESELYPKNQAEELAARLNALISRESVKMG